MAETRHMSSVPILTAQYVHIESSELLPFGRIAGRFSADPLKRMCFGPVLDFLEDRHGRKVLGRVKIQLRASLSAQEP